MSRFYECECCSSVEDTCICPIMTGVPFDAPKEEQRIVCKYCVLAWHVGGAVTYENGEQKAEAIRAESLRLRQKAKSKMELKDGTR